MSIKTSFIRLIPIFFIFVVVIVFFYKLFYPTLSIFVTPDFGQSDLFQLNYPAKFSLWEALHNNTLPFWNKYIGTGFPQIAEGQIGVFNLSNILLYKFLPFTLALNVGYMLIFLTSSIGTYAYLRFLKLTKSSSFIGGILFGFSGFFVTHMAHINLIHAASYLPWLFLIVHLYIEKKKPIYIFAFVLVAAQQFFAGFPQITFITFCGLALLYVWNFKSMKKNSSRKLAFILPAMGLILFIGLIAVQLFPSKELLDISVRKDGFILSEAAKYSFPWKHFIGFVQPNFFGTPQNGTYPVFTKFDNSIYWENNGYIGVIPLLFFLIAFFKKKKTTHEKFYTYLLFLAALLMIGKYSPLYFIYSFPPFSFFRVPSRFILLFVWGLVIVVTYGIDFFREKAQKFITNKFKLAIFVLIMVAGTTTQLLYYGYTYNPIGKASEWFKEPVLTQKLSSTERSYTVASGLLWNTFFLKDGWKNLSPFLTMQNYTKPNANILFHKHTYQVYPILTTKRYELVSSLIEQSIPLDATKETFEVTDRGKKLMQLNNTSTIFSAYKNKDIKEVSSVTLGNKTLHLYSLLNTPKKAFITYDYKLVSTFEDFAKETSTANYDPYKVVFLEKKPRDFQSMSTDTVPKNSVSVIKDEHTHVELSAESDQNGLLVLTDLFYPGWEAQVDGKPAEILAANITQRAIVLPKGSHNVIFSYKPISIRNGAIISIVTHVIIISVVFAGMLLVARRKPSSIL